MIWKFAMLGRPTPRISELTFLKESLERDGQSSGETARFVRRGNRGNHRGNRGEPVGNGGFLRFASFCEVVRGWNVDVTRNDVAVVGGLNRFFPRRFCFCFIWKWSTIPIVSIVPHHVHSVSLPNCHWKRGAPAFQTHNIHARWVRTNS